MPGRDRDVMLQLFNVPCVVKFKLPGNIAMKTVPNFYVRRVLPFLRQSPMLTAMMVYFVGLCMAASIAACAVWRENSRFPSAEAFGQPYLVQTASPAGRIIHDLQHREFT